MVDLKKGYAEPIKEKYFGTVSAIPGKETKNVMADLIQLLNQQQQKIESLEAKLNQAIELIDSAVTALDSITGSADK